MCDFLKAIKPIFNDRTLKKINGFKVGNNVYTEKLLLEQVTSVFQAAENSKQNAKSVNCYELKANIKNDVIEKIEGIYNNCPLFDLVLLGSYADNTYTLGSDIDDIVILKKNFFSDVSMFNIGMEILTKLNNLYFFTDPLQHHGHWVFFETELKDYDQSEMPEIVLGSAVSISRDLSIFVNSNNKISQIGLERIFKININNCKKWAKCLYEDSLSIYWLKHFVSSMSLIIPLMYQLNGEFFDKKRALAKSEAILDNRALAVKNWVALIRHRWGEIRGVSSYYFLYRALFCIYRNHRLMHKVSRNITPTVTAKDVTFLSDITIEDVNYYISIIERKAYGNY